MPITNGVLTITPDDIKITHHLYDAFGHYETEISAQWLVRFAQARGKGWEPFTMEEIEAFYNKDGGYRDFSFNRLIGERYIRSTEGKFHFTERFISNCYESSV